MSPTSARRHGERLSRSVCVGLLVTCFLILVPTQMRIDRELGDFKSIEEVLYLPSGKILRRLSLGYEGLLADIYWTRAVQYFGRRRMVQATRYDLLGPLLRITTDLDPHLLIAYRFGSVFLAEKPPWGAGQPQQALQLLRKGIVANPYYWRLWEDLGFVYYWDLKDYDTAARVFEIGSERPGALVWMKVLAATVAAKGHEIQTSQLLWMEIYRHAENDQIRQSALAHLEALEAQAQINQLNRSLKQLQEKQGYSPRSFEDLVTKGYLKAVPKDPSGAPYMIGLDGRVTLSPQSKIEMQLLQ